MIPPPAQRFMAKRAGSTVVEETGAATPSTRLSRAEAISRGPSERAVGRAPVATRGCHFAFESQTVLAFDDELVPGWTASRWTPARPRCYDERSGQQPEDRGIGPEPDPQA